MSPWIESHDSLRDHPKLDRLIDGLELSRPSAIGHLHLLWWRALAYADDGDLTGLSDRQIARWAEYTGDADEFVRALTEAGFLDGDRKIHDWFDYAGRYQVQREKNAERMRKARASHKHNTSGARPGATGPDRTNTGPDPYPPTPLPHGGRGNAAARRAQTQHKASEPTMAASSSLSAEEMAAWELR